MTKRYQLLLDWWIVSVFALAPVFGALYYTAPSFPPPAPALTRVIGAIVAAGFLLYLLMGLMVRRDRAAAAAVTTLFVLFVLYPTARELFVSGVFRMPGFYFAIFYALASLSIAIRVAFASPAALTTLREVSAAMSVVLAAGYALLVWEFYVHAPRPFAPVVRAADRGILAAKLVPEAMPDVYHIILDAFGRPDTLRAQYGLDLGDFVGGLTGRGFQVYEDAVANYPQTYLSIGSMLSVTYLDHLAEENPRATSKVPVYEMIQQSPVLELFKRSGYQFVFIGSIYSATQSHRLADECVCDAPIIGEFESSIVGITPFRDIGFGGLDYRPHRNKILRSLAALESLPPSPRPRIVVAHVLAPHPPFVFDEAGRPVNAGRAFSVLDGNLFQGSRTEYVEGYKRQALYLANRLAGLLDHLEAVSRQSGREAFIVVHGDHGPRSRFDAMDAGKTDATEVLPVLLAIRWPRSSTPPKAVHSLVNVYREFIRRYVDPGFEQVPDRAFISSFAEPYHFIEVDVTALAPRPR